MSREKDTPLLTPDLAEMVSIVSASSFPKDDRWCLVRRMEDGFFCGPLSFFSEDGGSYAGLGFPNGKIGRLALFNSREEALSKVEDRGAASRDIPMSMGLLHFYVRLRMSYSGEECFLYDGGDYRMARVVCMLARGWIEGRNDKNYLRCEIECKSMASEMLKEK